MNLYTKQIQTHRHGKQTYSYQRGEGGGEGQIRSMGLTDTNYYPKIDKQQGFTFICTGKRKNSYDLLY